VPRRIYEPRREEVTGNLRKLHNKVHHNLFPSANIIRMIKIEEDGGHLYHTWKR
jgi:hypothetical protein